MSKPRNYSLHHEDNPHLDDVINWEDGTCTFTHDSIPENSVRTIDIMKGDRRLFSISVGPHGACYQILDAGKELGLFTLWDDEL